MTAGVLYSCNLSICCLFDVSKIKKFQVDIVAYDVKPPASFATSSSSSSSGGGEEAAAAGAKPPSQKQKQRLAKKKRKHKYYGPTPNEYHGETSQFCEVRFWKNE